MNLKDFDGKKPALTSPDKKFLKRFRKYKKKGKPFI